jgi:hypothetical protein
MYIPQKLNVILFFDIEFFKYFFRVLHEASNSWLKLYWFVLGHAVESFDIIIMRYFKYTLYTVCRRTSSP